MLPPAVLGPTTSTPAAAAARGAEEQHREQQRGCVVWVSRQTSHLPGGRAKRGCGGIVVRCLCCGHARHIAPACCSWGEAGAAGSRRPSSPVGQGRQPQQLEEQLQGMLQVQFTWHLEVSSGRRQVGCRSSADQQLLAIPTMRPPLAKAVAKHVAACAARLVLPRSQ